MMRHQLRKPPENFEVYWKAHMLTSRGAKSYTTVMGVYEFKATSPNVALRRATLQLEREGYELIEVVTIKETRLHTWLLSKGDPLK